MFDNRSKHGYHLIIKGLVEELFRRKYKKYITFLVPVKKELENNKTITCKIKFINSFRFMSSSISSLVNNLSEGFRKDQCTDCKSCLECISTKNTSLIF